MDWSKAKTILIIALVVTNLVLLVALYVGNLRISAEDEDLLLEMLAASNVQIDTDIPKKPGKMAVLYVKPEIIPPAELEKCINDVFDYKKLERQDDEELIRLFADELLEQSGLKDENTFIENAKKLASGWTVSFRDVFNGIPIEESYVKLHFDNGKYSKIERKWYKPISLHNKKGEIISPIKAAMQLLADKREDEAIIIKDIELVYWVNANVINILSPINDTAIPAWKLTDSNGNVTYIGGY